jgi:D-alanyl-lipoteichoic acid acyltransferase DltB (MBOAT superfamily)
MIPSSKIKAQNIVLLVSSYVFYGWWDYRFLGLIFLSTMVDYLIGIKIRDTIHIKRRKTLLLLSLVVNIGLLGFFKYYNFFVDSFIETFQFFGYQFSASSLNIILPVGISFYTFQTMSYTIDVYRGKMKSTTNFIAFASFVSFFPQLVAGPIERASKLLPQFTITRKFNYHLAKDGMRQILWGLFKKVVIADNCAIYVNQIFNDYGDYSGSTLFIGALLFSFQIYCDFSGYSDIAIGTARLFGFSLSKNFAFPYFSRDIAEFWRRWHISLSTWFRDYVYIPLGGSKVGSYKKIRNVFIIFIISGFWHGANWTFIFWGALNALYFLPLLLFNRNRKNLDDVSLKRLIPSLRQIASILFTFLITVFAWIFFRSESVHEAFQYINGIFSNSFFTKPQIYPEYLFILLILFISIEWIGRKNEYAIANFANALPRAIRWGFYILLIASMGIFMPTEQTTFIYFQF